MSAMRVVFNTLVLAGLGALGQPHPDSEVLSTRTAGTVLLQTDSKGRLHKAEPETGPEVLSASDADGPRGASDPPPDCCKALTAECLACEAGVTVEEYCATHADAIGCTQGAPPPTEAPPATETPSPSPADRRSAMDEGDGPGGGRSGVGEQRPSAGRGLTYP
mmetsp:Transcript_1073/g.3063  ORF Transcript_1073/g.3063 Transcript_1073/m.3063 type:complete len:163 (+) Transcript_1073:86-574(+)